MNRATGQMKVTTESARNRVIWRGLAVGGAREMSPEGVHTRRAMWSVRNRLGRVIHFQTAIGGCVSAAAENADFRDIVGENDLRREPGTALRRQLNVCLCELRAALEKSRRHCVETRRPDQRSICCNKTRPGAPSHGITELATQVGFFDMESFGNL